MTRHIFLDVIFWKIFVKKTFFFSFPLEDKESSINRKKRRPYTKQQIQQLEQEYRMNTYIARERRLDLGKNLNLSDRQVKVSCQEQVFFVKF